MLRGSPPPACSSSSPDLQPRTPGKMSPSSIPTCSGAFTSIAESSRDGPTLPVSTVSDTVLLHDWWLVKLGKDSDTEKLAVGGFIDKGAQELRIFKSAPIIKRFDAFTLETADGITVKLQGFINQKRTDSSGFPPEVCTYFMVGFPYQWEACVDKYLKKCSLNPQCSHPRKEASVDEEHSKNASYDFMSVDGTHDCPVYFDKIQTSRIFDDFLNFAYQNEADLRRNSLDPSPSTTRNSLLFSSYSNEHNDKLESKCKEKPKNECKLNAEYREYSIRPENCIISKRRSGSDGSAYLADEITLPKKVKQVQESIAQEECHNDSSKEVRETDNLVETAKSASEIIQLASIKDTLEIQTFRSDFTGHSTDIQDQPETATIDKCNTSISCLQISHSLEESSPEELNESHLSLILSGIATSKEKLQNTSDIVSASAPQPSDNKAGAMVRNPSCSVLNASDESNSVCCSSEYGKHGQSDLLLHKSCQGNHFDSFASGRPANIVKHTCNAYKRRNLGIHLKNLKSTGTTSSNAALKKCDFACETHDIMRKSHLKLKEKEKLMTTSKDEDNLNFSHKFPVPCIATPKTEVRVERSDRLTVNENHSSSGVEDDQKAPSGGNIIAVSNFSTPVSSSCQDPSKRKKKKETKPSCSSYIRQGPVTREAASKTFASPELLNYKRSRSGRVLVPKLDSTCQQIVYDSDGAIAGILSSFDETRSPCIGIKSKLRSRSKKQSDF